MDHGGDGLRIAAAAGARRPAVGADLRRRSSWEGLNYRIDLFAAEHARLKRIREQIESPGLDAAIAAGDPEKIADALLALVYAPALGDPEGPALLGGDIAQRHNFGLVGPAGMRRDFVAWSLPREQVGDGSPWHLEGSIVGLDIALARLALRRIESDEMPSAPTINLNDQLTFARTVMALNPRALTRSGSRPDRRGDRARPRAREGRRREPARRAGAGHRGAAAGVGAADAAPGRSRARPTRCPRCLAFET